MSRAPLVWSSTVVLAVLLAACSREQPRPALAKARAGAEASPFLGAPTIPGEVTREQVVQWMSQTPAVASDGSGFRWVDFPRSTEALSPVTVSEIIGDRKIGRVEVLLDRAMFFGPVDHHTEIVQMLSLLASPEAVSETPPSLLALEDKGPAIRITLDVGGPIIIRRIHFDCYRIYWEGKTAWFRRFPRVGVSPRRSTRSGAD